MAIKHTAEKIDDGISLSAPVIMELIEAVHAKGVPFRFQARGHSMSPAIRDGDVITVAPLNNLLPRRGDVLAFRHPERPQLLVHRVLGRKMDKLVMKGDSCPIADGVIPAENILGLISQVERNGRNLFWPNRRNAWAHFYLWIYVLWLPIRQLLIRGYRLVKK